MIRCQPLFELFRLRTARGFHGANRTQTCVPRAFRTFRPSAVTRSPRLGCCGAQSRTAWHK